MDFVTGISPFVMGLWAAWLFWGVALMVWYRSVRTAVPPLAPVRRQVSRATRTTDDVQMPLGFQDQ